MKEGASLETGKEKRNGYYVFTNLKTGRPLVSIRTAFETAAKKAGIADFLFHDLCHTGGTQLNLAGIDLMTIKETLGHEDVGTTYGMRTPLNNANAPVAQLDRATDF